MEQFERIRRDHRDEGLSIRALAAKHRVHGAIPDGVETAVLAELLPPLNVAKVSTPWRPLVQAGRRRLAAQAESWAESPGAPT